ncbi:hypothetical protein BZK31_24465 [Pseudomonas floridensis]|uniref:Uncharacterized protein n=1 Tax=Pseudomonas floridensis TaxID=1958950 RepID=A0A1X0MZE5_9PSED|nr:hypothetical protein BZK31_24465 [Pseudomonas floridensis]
MAQIKINRDGRTVYQESQTFNCQQIAQARISGEKCSRFSQVPWSRLQERDPLSDDDLYWIV